MNKNFEVILLDIEGTTSPIDFVYNTLFPYARQRLSAYLEMHELSEDLQEMLRTLKAEFLSDTAAASAIPSYTPLGYLNYLMDQDKKSPALKSIQGKIWESGFKSGELHGALYPDVAPALERWRSAGYKTYIYSSGSVLAQKLLFQFSVAGNLTCFLYGHFDTGVGAKTESKSYQAIAEKIYTDPKQILFISDAPKELIAAKAAGCQVLFSDRPGNIYTNDDGFETITSFDNI